jgi:hypothetical protein
VGGMSRTHWLTAPLGSAEYRVYLADGDDPLLASDRPDSGPCEGATCHTTSTIVINRSLPRKRVPEVLIHELAHAACHISGIAITLKWKLPREEQVVHALAPMLAHALSGGGLLKLPRVPK